jgi:redox-sensitive bicupin YhaK (pirin superfamily)
MSNTSLIIEERSRDIGDFLVGRLLPFRKKRMVGPFIFIDHMGPSTIGPGHYMDIGQHPHIGLSTLTYLFEGEIIHEDSIGSEQRITPGSVNWMTAGKGVVHTERTPEDWRDGNQYQVHGFQIWVALPKALEEMEPEFHHIPQQQLPQWQENGLEFILIAGQGYGKTAPVPVHSELFMVQVRSTEATAFDIDGHLSGEIGICVVKGYIEACGERIEEGKMLVSKEDDQCAPSRSAKTLISCCLAAPRFLKNAIFSGTLSLPIGKPSKRPKSGGKTKNSPMIPHDSSYIPLP